MTAQDQAKLEKILEQTDQAVIAQNKKAFLIWILISTELVMKLLENERFGTGWKVIVRT